MYGFAYGYKNESGEVEDMFWSGDDVSEVLDIACVTASLTHDSIPVYYYPGDGCRELYCTAIPANRAVEYPLHRPAHGRSAFLATPHSAAPIALHSAANGVSEFLAALFA